MPRLQKAPESDPRILISPPALPRFVFVIRSWTLYPASTGALFGPSGHFLPGLPLSPSLRILLSFS